MDVGDQNGLRFDAIQLDESLDRNGILNSFAIYRVTHPIVVTDRFQSFIMTFFSKSLCFRAVCH